MDVSPKKYKREYLTSTFVDFLSDFLAHLSELLPNNI